MNSNLPLVSIVMPFFNASFYFLDTLNSIKVQTYPNWELLIVDDCSTDLKAIEMLNWVSKEDGRIKVFKTKENGGAGIARNIGINAANGRYLAFCDSDDWWYPNKLQMQLDYMSRNGYSFCCSYYEDSDDSLKPYYVMKQRPRQDFKCLLSGCNVGTPGVMIDVSVIGKVMMPPLRRAEDWGCWLTILKKTDYLYTCPQVLWKYRHIPGSETSNKLKMLNSVVNMYIIVLGFGRIKAWLYAIFVFLPTNILKKVKKHLRLNHYYF